jgi:hypothetical protein
MSYEGRYMAVPPSEKALSKLGLEVIARKWVKILSVHKIDLIQMLIYKKVVCV